MAYRTAPAATAPAPPRKWPYRLALTGFTFLAVAVGFMLLVDFGAHVDGPGVGYGLGILMVFSVMSVGSLIAALVLGIKWPWARWIGWPTGFVLALVFIFARGPIRLLHVSWETGCAYGKGADCYAWASQFQGAERSKLRQKACANNYYSACDALLEGTDEEKKAVCDSRLGITCMTCIHGMCDVPQTTCMQLNTVCRSMH